MPRRRIGPGIWVGSIAVVAIGIAGWITFARIELLNAATGWVHHTEQVRFTLQGVLASLQTMESGTRGFVITRDEEILRPSIEARQHLEADLHSLMGLVVDNPAQLARAREVEKLARARLDALDRAVQSIRDGTFQLPRGPVSASEGVRLARAVNAQVALMQSQEDALLKQRLAQASSARLTALISAVGLSVVAAFLVLLSLGIDRRAQRDLEASEERLRLALEGAQLGALDHDLATGRTVWNERLYAITGHPAHTPVTGGMLHLGTPDEEWKQVADALRRANRERLPFQLEHRIVRVNDGAARWVSSNGRYLYDAEGRGIRFLGVVRDVTEERLLEQRVRDAQKLDALGTLAGGIAHDFNNILAVLRGNLAAIRADIPADHVLMPFLVDMANACDRAAALVRQILTFGRQHQAERAVMQLGEVVEEAVKLLRATIPAQVDIRTQLADGLPPALIDRNQVHQIITNLGINSAHAISPGTGVIEIQLDDIEVDAALAQTSPDLHEGRYVRLRFSDSGSGIPKDILERIFEPFFTTKPPHSGTGLGLSVVRGILKNHDAAISVYSEPGKGTRFHLYFPATAAQAAPVPGAPNAPRKGRGERILYIDDEESLVLLAGRMLERMGYRVSGFTDSARALAAFEAAPGDFDLILTDLSMPGASGMDVAKAILSIRPDIPVLLATGYVRPEDVECARAIGIREVIWKPHTVGEMGEQLAQQLEKLVPGNCNRVEPQRAAIGAGALGAHVVPPSVTCPSAGSSVVGNGCGELPAGGTQS
ncbi:MAG TPA: CHASE3 domain-containing protein [Steroidobacteraceae bacterium]|nr:CHASE3 domain-containing protein [Steroidobacteraceae bacterium]